MNQLAPHTTHNCYYFALLQQLYYHASVALPWYLDLFLFTRRVERNKCQGFRVIFELFPVIQSFYWQYHVVMPDDTVASLIDNDDRPF